MTCREASEFLLEYSQRRARGRGVRRVRNAHGGLSQLRAVRHAIPGDDRRRTRLSRRDGRRRVDAVPGRSCAGNSGGDCEGTTVGRTFRSALLAVNTRGGPEGPPYARHVRRDVHATGSPRGRARR